MEVNVNIATTIAHDIRNDKIPIAFAFYFHIRRRRTKTSTRNINCRTSCPSSAPHLEGKINEANETASFVGDDKKILRAAERLTNAGSLQRSRHCVRKSNELHQG